MKNMTLSRKNLCIPYALFLALFVIAPLCIIVAYAFTDASWKFTLSNFSDFFSNTTQMNIFFRSLFVAILTTVACILIGYPIAYLLARTKILPAKGIIVLFILPMWISFLLRTLALRDIFEAMHIELGAFTVTFGMVYDFLPFMILPVYTQLLKMDQHYIEAAHDLGANSFVTFFKVVIPLSLPGIMSGALMVFMPTISTYAIADLLSRNTYTLIGNFISEEFSSSGSQGWHTASAVSVIIFTIVAIAMVFKRDKQQEEGLKW